MSNITQKDIVRGLKQDLDKLVKTYKKLAREHKKTLDRREVLEAAMSVIEEQHRDLKRHIFYNMPNSKIKQKYLAVEEWYAAGGL